MIKKIYKINFHKESKIELDKMDGSTRLKVLKQIKKLEEKPQLSDALGKKHGFDLTGYNKLYVDNKRIRIVYKIFENEILVLIISIGRREDLSVYKKAFERI